MKKFRVLSDLHVDLNESLGHFFELKDKDVFTVLCGDTSGDPRTTIRWANSNLKAGLLIAGNHLPYNDQNTTIQELREQLAAEFPLDHSITYLDVETGAFSKEVDGILFVGTTMYSNFGISDDVWNPTGNKKLNKEGSFRCMNDYRYGRVKGIDGKHAQMIPDDYERWFHNALDKIDRLLSSNESADVVKPVVLITHHALLTDTIKHNGYVEQYFDNPREFNWSSYASDCKDWLLSHPSIKCYLYGHIHDIYSGHRYFDLKRDDGSRILICNNCRGYVNNFHDLEFNPNTFVNVETWEIEQIPFTEEECKEKEEARKSMLKFNLAAFF